MTLERDHIVPRIASGDKEAVLEWINSEPDLEAPLVEDLNALSLATHMSDINADIVMCLLDAKCSVNIIADDGTSPLMHAAKKSDVELICIKMIELGSDINLKNLSDKSVLAYACHGKKPKNAHILLASGCEFDLCGETLPFGVNALAKKSISQINVIRSTAWANDRVTDLVIQFMIHEGNIAEAEVRTHVVKVPEIKSSYKAIDYSKWDDIELSSDSES